MENDETVVSYDVVSLCTSIPIDRCLNFINGLLENDHTLSNRFLLSISLIMKSLKPTKSSSYKILRVPDCSQPVYVTFIIKYFRQWNQTTIRSQVNRWNFFRHEKDYYDTFLNWSILSLITLRSIMEMTKMSCHF